MLLSFLLNLQLFQLIAEEIVSLSLAQTGTSINIYDKSNNQFFFPLQRPWELQMLDSLQMQASLKRWLTSPFNASPLRKCFKIKHVRAFVLGQEEVLLFLKDDLNCVKIWEITCKFRKQAQR